MRGPLLALAATMVGVSALWAQDVPRPRLEGRVVRGEDDAAGVAAAVVVLHRVTPDTAGEIDTTRAGSGGDFVFELPSLPDPLLFGDVYFASVEHDGVLYFGPPVHEPEQLAEPYRIEVHDTTVAPPGGQRLPLRVRYVILDPRDDGWVVTDLFQLENTGDRTIVTAEGGAVWSYPLPPGLVELEVGAGDAAPEAVQVSDGTLRVSAPMPPGPRQYMVRYRMTAPRLELELPGSVEVLELLVREPAPPLSVQGLMANQSVEMEPGVTYRRYSGLDLLDARVLVLPGSEAWSLPLEWLAVILALVLAGAALWAVQGAPARAGAGGGGPLPPTDPTPSIAEARERLLLEVAELDERLEDGELPPGERAELSRRRGALLERLRELR